MLEVYGNVIACDYLIYVYDKTESLMITWEKLITLMIYQLKYIHDVYITDSEVEVVSCLKYK